MPTIVIPLPSPGATSFAGSTTLAPHASATYCMFCGSRVTDAGEAYDDHLRLNKSCESAWRTWRENLLADHPGAD